MIIKKMLKHMAFKHGKLVPLWVRVCKPWGDEFAEFLKVRGTLHAIGEGCSISPHAVITDPKYVSMGDNVRLSDCTLLGHDGSVNMLRDAYGVHVDNIGKIVIRSNVFIGLGAIIMPDVEIGPKAIVGAGAVVTRDVMPGDIVGGVPAKTIGRVDDYVERLVRKNKDLPWNDILKARGSSFDAKLEPILLGIRLDYFWGKQGGK